MTPRLRLLPMLLAALLFGIGSLLNTFAPLQNPAQAEDAAAPAAVKPDSRPDEWWQSRHKIMNTRAELDAYDVLFIGDSITQGWEGEGQNAWEAVYRGRNALNLGIGGDRTQHVLWRLQNGNLKNQKPKLAILMIGTNNASGSDSPEAIAAGNKAIVEEIRKQSPDTKILVLGIFPRGANKDDQAYQINVKVNEIISKLADDQHVFYLDIGPAFLKEDGTLTKEIMPDFLHLSPQGYQIWAEAMEPTVAKLLGESPKEVPALVETRSKLLPTLRPVPRDGGWLTRHLAFNHYARQGNSDMVLIGDSITHGWEGGGKDIWAKHFAPRKALNLGISGDRTEHVLWRLDDGNLKGINPKLAVIMIGTNNSGANTSEEIAAGIEGIVKKLHEQRPEMKILILGIFPRGEKPDDPKRKVNEGANTIVSKLEDGKHVFYLDIGPKFLGEGGVLSKEIMPDLLHLSPQGYQIWAESIEPKVAELMGEK